MAILTDTTIHREIENGNIVVEPLIQENIGTNSIDLTLGDKLMIYLDEVLDVREKPRTAEIKIPEDGIILMPGRLYLASTVERTETRGCVPVIEGKSSLGRLGLFVHVTAGFGDDGFEGKWTLELNTIHPLRVYQGMKICQISYHTTTEPPLRSYAQKTDAKYQGQSDVTASRMHMNFDERLQELIGKSK